MDGWGNGELTYFGALPGKGKMAFMVQMMREATKAGCKAGFISLEMTEQQSRQTRPLQSFPPLTSQTATLKIGFVVHVISTGLAGAKGTRVYD